MKYVIILLLMINIPIFSVTKIAIEPNLNKQFAAEIRESSHELIYKISENLKMLLDKDTLDTNGGGEWEVLILREKSGGIYLPITDSEMIQKSNDFNADLYLDIKVNVNGDSTISGIEIKAKESDINAVTLATRIQEKLINLLNLDGRHHFINESWFSSLNENTKVIMAYLAFYSNPSDRALLENKKMEIAKELMYALQAHYFNSDPYDPQDDNDGPIITITSHNNNDTVSTTSILLEGKVEDYSEVSTFKINNEEVTLNNKLFSKSIELFEGNNNITFFAEDNRGNQTQSSINIIYHQEDNDGPIITISSHNNNDTVSSESILLKGKIEDSSEILTFKINNEEVILNNKLFSKMITLSEGNNNIIFFAEDSFGNQTENSINITYVVPITDHTPPLINIISPINNKHFAFDQGNITISGNVTDNSEIKVFKINGEDILLNGGDFSYNKKLSFEENIFTFEAIDEYDNRATKNLTLYLDKEVITDKTPPTIIVNTPIHASSVNKSLIETIGQVKDSDGISYFTINDTSITLDNNNRFKFNIILSVGENKIVYKAVDNLNNETVKILLVNYEVEFQKEETCSYGNSYNYNYIFLFLFLFFIIRFKFIKN